MAGPWSHLLDKTITYQLRNGVTGAGDPTYGAQVTAKARVDKKLIRTADEGGLQEGVRWETATIVTVEINIPQGSRVWLPGANTAVVNESNPVRKVSGSNIPNRSIGLWELKL